MESNNVFIFPCVSRSSDSKYELKSKLMSEENVTNILKSIADKKSFVLSYADGVLKFVLDGYYFELSEFNLSGNKYAYISYKDNSDSNGFKLINGDDIDGTFSGLKIQSTISNPNDVDGEDYLTLCVNGQIPNSSFSKFKLSSVDGKFGNIDCGELK